MYSLPERAPTGPRPIRWPGPWKRDQLKKYFRASAIPLHQPIQHCHRLGLSLEFAHPLPHQPGDADEDPPPPCRDAGNADRGPGPCESRGRRKRLRRRLYACGSRLRLQRVRAHPWPVPVPGGIQGESAAPSVRWEDRWGAIAVDSVTGKTGVAGSKATRRQAEEAALAICAQKGGGDCKVNLSYANQCGVIAWGNNRTSARFAATLEEASRLALNECAQVSGGTCEVFFPIAACRCACNSRQKEKPRGTCVPRGCRTLLTQRQISVRIGLVRRRGLEPLHLLRRQDLNLVRLPISPPSL